MAQESRLSIVIDSAAAEARIKELRKQLRELGGAADQAADDTGDLGNRADRASRDTNRLNASAASGKKALDGMAKAAALAGAALAGGLALSINKAQSWESSLAEINKTVEFATEDGLANMRKGLQELSTQIPQTFEELAAVTATGGQLGIAEENLIGFTETMAKMGVAFDIPAQQAADSMAKIANVFQIPIENISNLGDAINTLSNNTPATAAQLIDSLQRVGGVAKVFGLSADATLGLTGALIAMGKPAEVASTAVNSLLTSFSTLDNATKSQLIGFEQLGLDIDKFSDLVAVDGKQAIITYLEAINELDKSQRIGTNALILGKEFGDDITMLAGSVGVLENNWALLGETANTTKDYFGSMDAEFVKISETSANKMQLFKNNIDGVVAGVGEAFIPALNDLLATMTPFIATMSIWVSENPELIQQIVTIGGSLAASIVSLKLFADGVNAAKTTIDGLKLAYTALASPMALTVLALGALVVAGVLVYENWDLISKTISENKALFTVIGGVIGGVSAILLIHNAALIATSVAAAASAVSTGVMTAATAVWTTVTTVAATATWAFGAAVAFLTSPIGIVVIAIGALVAAGVLLYKNWDKISEWANTKWAAIESTIRGKVNAAKEAISNAWAAAKTATVNKFNEIKSSITTTLAELPKKMLTIGKQVVQGLIDGITGGASKVISAIGDMAASAIATAKSVLNIRSPSRVMTTIGLQTAKGMENGIKKGAKTVKSEAQKMAEGAIEAVQAGIDRIKKELALFGSNSNLADLEYDIKIGKYNGASDASKNEYRNLVAELEAKTKLAAANKSVQDSIDGLIRQQALFGNDSSLAALMYDIEHTDKFKDATKELTDELIKQTTAWERMGAVAKATAAIQARFTQLGKDKESSSTNLQGMLSGIEQESPMGKIQADYEARNALIEKYEQTHTDMVNVANEARLASDQAYMDAKRNLMLDQGEALFGNLAGLSKVFLGEQAGMYKALFAIEKGYTLAKVLLKNKEAIAEAWASAPFPYNIPAVATTVAGTAGLASAVSSIVPGFKQGGYTGNIGVNQVAGPVHGQEYVFDAASTKRIGVDNLNAMRSGKAANDSGGDVNISVTVTGDNATVSGDNEKMGRQMANGIKAVVMDVMRKEKRQGGMLYGA
tara:strand:+ start:30115 stop:33528 length:3414 start_codon:yes stop_codon:yes gene_type:complete